MPCRRSALLKVLSNYGGGTVADVPKRSSLPLTALNVAD